MNTEEYLREKEKSLGFTLSKTICPNCGEIEFWRGPTYDLRYTNHVCLDEDVQKMQEMRRKDLRVERRKKMEKILGYEQRS